MKVCPQCKSEFDDDSLVLCPNDKTYLVSEGAASNPRMADVIQVDEGAETSIFDVGELRGELSHPGVGEPDNSTELLTKEQLDQVKDELAKRSQQTKDQTSTKAPAAAVVPPKEKGSSRRGLLAAVAAASLGVVILAGLLVFLLWPQPTMLQIATSPEGAKVEINGVLSGEAPVSIEVEPGPHSITLSLEGYHSFAQVIEVPKGGRPLTVALAKKEELPDEPDDEPVDSSIKANAEAVFQAVDALIEVGEFDEADSRLQVLASLVPGDERVAAALKRVAEARAAAEKDKEKLAKANPGGKKGKISVDGNENIAAMPRKQREREADKLYRAGQRLYKKSDFSGAKDSLLRAIRYDPRFYPPHRVLARIYNREKNVTKAKYHLTRYIELGGADDDYKIRQWLATH